MSTPLVIGGVEHERFVLCDSDGNPILSPNVYKTISALTITFEQTVWDPAAGKRFRLMGYCLGSTVVGGNVTVKDGNSGSTILVIPLGVASNGMPTPLPGRGILSVAPDNNLRVIGPATMALSGYFYGREE